MSEDYTSLSESYDSLSLRERTILLKNAKNVVSSIYEIDLDRALASDIASYNESIDSRDVGLTMGILERLYDSDYRACEEGPIAWDLDRMKSEIDFDELKDYLSE